MTEKKSFEPKQPVKLDPPKYDPISVEELSKCDGIYILFLGFLCLCLLYFLPPKDSCRRYILDQSTIPYPP